MWAMDEAYGMNCTECNLQNNWSYISFTQLSASVTELKHCGNSNKRCKNAVLQEK